MIQTYQYDLPTTLTQHVRKERMRMAQRTIRFGVIGCGLMGREFASATQRWAHLLNMDVRPDLVAVADTKPSCLDWFTDNLCDITTAVTDYHELLANPDVDAVYCAVPHHLHAQIYGDVIRAGKHLLGEKPFGIDLAANERSWPTLAATPAGLRPLLVRVPLLPGAVPDRPVSGRRAASAGSSRSRPASGTPATWTRSKPINWKRMVAVQRRVRLHGRPGDARAAHPAALRLDARATCAALLSKIVTERPDGKGGMAPCETWDNAILACEVQTADQHFPMLLSTKRIAPGETNTWFIKIHGTEFSAEFTHQVPEDAAHHDLPAGQAAGWEVLDLATRRLPDDHRRHLRVRLLGRILQMWAAFCDELVHGRTGCASRSAAPRRRRRTCTTGCSRRRWSRSAGSRS